MSENHAGLKQALRARLSGNRKRAAFAALAYHLLLREMCITNASVIFSAYGLWDREPFRLAGGGDACDRLHQGCRTDLSCSSSVNPSE
jgi:hypothetical protein